MGSGEVTRRIVWKRMFLHRLCRCGNWAVKHVTGKRVYITQTKQGPSLTYLLCFSASLLEITLQDNCSISTYLTGYFYPSPHSLILKVVVSCYGCLQLTSGSQGFLRTDFVEYCVTEFTKSEWNSSHSMELLCLFI